MNRVEHALSYPVSIFIGGDYESAHDICQAYCDEVGLCVTVTATSYVFTGGQAPGVIVGLINYPRFPKPHYEIWEQARDLAYKLREELGQESFSIQTPERTSWFSWREVDALAAAARQGGDVQQAPGEAPQSGGDSRNAQKPSSPRKSNV